jgi:hypothetical protein
VTVGSDAGPGWSEVLGIGSVSRSLQSQPAGAPAAPLPDGGPVDVRAVRGWSDLRAFIDLPYRLHADTPWVPPVRVERWAYLNRRFNPFFTHGRACLFLARRNGEVVGRISAQVDDAYNSHHDSRWGMFGLIEMQEDLAIAVALLDAAESWLRAEGCDRMVGPMDLTLNDESGILIEGYELEPQIKQPWHPPYYRRLCEAARLEKAMDLYSYSLNVGDRASLSPILPKVAERAQHRHGITIRKMSRRHLRKDLDVFAEIYNDAWSSNWGFVPYGKKDLDTYALDLQFVFVDGWSMVAEHDGEPVGMAITVLNLNQVLRRVKGRLLPFGWWYLLNRKRYVDEVRVGFLGVKRKFQYSGAAAALYLEHFAMAERSSLKKGEAGWILEVNSGMIKGLEAMNGRIVKRYRVYKRTFRDSAQ